MDFLRRIDLIPFSLLVFCVFSPEQDVLVVTHKVALWNNFAILYIFHDKGRFVEAILSSYRMLKR